MIHLSKVRSLRSLGARLEVNYAIPWAMCSWSLCHIWGRLHEGLAASHNPEDYVGLSYKKTERMGTGHIRGLTGNINQGIAATICTSQVRIPKENLWWEVKSDRKGLIVRYVYVP